MDPQVGGLQEILDFFGVGVESRGVDVDVRREHPVDDGSQGTGGHAGVPLLAHSLVQESGGALVDPGEGALAVVGEVAVDLPGLAPVVRLLNVHGSRTERLERDDQVSHVELGLQVQLDGHVLLAVLRLPPGLVAGAPLSFRALHSVHDVADPMGGPELKSLKSKWWQP